MATITFNNLKSYQAIAIMNKISNYTGMAVQGKSKCRYVSGGNVSATAKPEQKLGINDEYLDFNNQTVEISSCYFSENTLNEILEQTINDNLIN